MANLQPTDHANCSDLIIAICKQHEAVRRDLNRLTVTLQEFDVSIEFKASEGSLQDEQIKLQKIVDIATLRERLKNAISLHDSAKDLLDIDSVDKRRWLKHIISYAVLGATIGGLVIRSVMASGKWLPFVISVFSALAAINRWQEVSNNRKLLSALKEDQSDLERHVSELNDHLNTVTEKLMAKIKNVVCGISGGVDSAVSAYLLKQKGFNVRGVFMKNWDSINEKGECLADHDYEIAQRVCWKLGIELTFIDFIKKYWNEVFVPMLKNYEKGFTPNPDVVCNKQIKFGSFFRYASTKLQADAIATGHYARNSYGDFLENINPADDARLLRPTDTWKDQTLFLSNINQTALRRTMFPIGTLMKSEVRNIAKDIGLDMVANRKDSTGICFIGTRNFSTFIEQYIEPKPGKFIDIETGKILGKHKGVHYWTLGQRALLSGFSKPYFIAKLDADSQNIFVASGTNHPSLFSTTFYTAEPHWIRSQIDTTKNVGFRFQNNQNIKECQFSKAGERYKVELKEPMRALTPGQYAVFYRDNECLGGAEITSIGSTLYDLQT
ncbi:DgyrCDS11184 [Dimorphilus gyrociliatus]|uniref:tRNA-5-taurinomethyluridine 2-sulfurtransferase n=1 Tax=Dimorphilus gyrociliatus TaxID=2664684 RepID=A0A7I8W2I5_9ANNE|nr:DgyrCDS11184 [Dimorphilus gyrociliatus]